MKHLKTSVSALALAAMLAGGAALMPAVNALAQTAPQTAPQATPAKPQHEHRFSMSRHVEGRIAFLKAELKITDAQAAQFNKVADVMRANAKDADAAVKAMRGDRDQPENAVERLEMRSKLTAMRAEHEQRFLAAFKPLYDSLTPDQKQAADEMLKPHHHRHDHA